MMRPQKVSRCGFVVIKLRIRDEDFLLMRENKKWRDINLIGGHEQPRDARNLERAARRELLEEVPPLRNMRNFELIPLTGEIEHGPVYSQSARCDVKYQLAFFFLKFNSSPQALVVKLGARTSNVLVRENDVLKESGHRMSGLVKVLDEALPGGIPALSLSWPNDLGAEIGSTVQMELPLKWRTSEGG